MRVKNWSKFQHFKDRKPPWVKLYRDILDDMQWHKLDGQSAKVLTMLWLIASEDDGKLPDIATLAFRLRMSEKAVSECCSNLSHWLEQSDIGVISVRYQDDPLERETEREEETEKEKTPRKRAVASAPPPPDGVSEQIWSDWLNLRKSKRAPVTRTVLTEAQAEAQKAGLTLERFLAVWCARGSQGLQADWLKPHERGSPELNGHKYAAAHKAIFDGVLDD